MTLLEKYNKTTEKCTMIGDDVWCWIKRDGDAAEVGFQSTATVRGVFIDITFPKMIYKDEPEKWLVHRGFGKSFKTAIDSIAETLNGVKTLRVYGYSKGGAYAILMHEWATFAGLDVRTFTFGAPAIIKRPSKAIKARFSNLYNISICGDWCTLIACLIGYSHVGQRVRLGNPRLDLWNNYHVKYLQYLADL